MQSVLFIYFLYVSRNCPQSLLVSVDKNMAKDFKHILFWLPVWDLLSSSQSLLHLQSD